ncbi:MAG: hypothetical protein DWI11_05790 [Planctomycetota bacterium]|nr:MAG: hypothetical protein DWI11_05790 [Planctomycetota bacterium]
MLSCGKLAARADRISELPMPLDRAQLHEFLLARGPYPLEAYEFLQQGLQHTVQRMHATQSVHANEPFRGGHITGQQLCFGLRDLAISQYGFLAPAVLAHWRVQRTGDFGTMVYTLIEAGLMSRNEQDRLEDFGNVYDFDEAFSPRELATSIGRG